MDNAGLQSLLKRLCNVLWSANVTNPITYVTQISYLLFLKMLEEMETEQRDTNSTNGRTTPELFKVIKIGDEEVDFGKLRWSSPPTRTTTACSELCATCSPSSR